MSDWKQKIVAVTGGSAGLGLAIAQAFAGRGASVVLIARDQGRLDRAVDELQPLNVSGVSADVTDIGAAQSAFDQIVTQHGRLDVLINNVGKSVRIDLDKTTPDIYREYMEVNFLSAVHCTRAAIDAIAKTSGHIVNIGSLSSKTAWPFMAPYSTSKFALAAYTHQLRLEGPQNIHYMLVCPGPIKRPDSGLRYDKQAKGLPARARKPAAGIKVRGADPAVISRRIVRGCERRKAELVPLRARLVFTALAWSPRLGDWLLKRKMKD